MTHRTAISRTYCLPALHTLSGAGFSDRQNLRVFGPCSRLHGHDYRIEVSVSGPLDPHSGLLVNRDVLDQIVDDCLIQPYRGTNLSDHFRHTTGEALAASFFELLKRALPSSLTLEKVCVHETAKNSFSTEHRCPA
ncbi:MAG: 6-carboxytetrahydropterin synthase [Acidobacteriota bacterium]|nr:MAG: 6-carboxytetrahydropterin synthase [Acidobacteriota bacterium]